MSFFDAVLILGAVLGGTYMLAWIASRAFFANKADYNRKILKHLKERDDAEEKVEK